MSSGTFPLQVKLSISDEASKALSDFNAGVKEMIAPAKEAAKSVAKLAKEMGVDHLGKALAEVKTRFGNTATEIKKLGKSAMWLVGGVTAAGGGLFAMAKKSADNADNLELQAKQVGLSTKAWHELSFAADRTGSSASSLHNGLTTLNKSIVSAARGNREMASAFEDAGVAVKDEAGNIRNADDVFTDLTNRFADLEDGPKKTALAMKLFGNAGSDLLPMLDKGSAAIDLQRRRADELKGSWSGEALASAARFKDSLTDLIDAVGGVSDAIGQRLHPILEPCITRVTDLVVEFRKWIESSPELDQWLDELTKDACQFCGDLRNLWEETKALGLRVNEVVQKMGGWKEVLVYIGIALAALKIMPLVTSLFMLTQSVVGVGGAVLGVGSRLVVWLSSLIPGAIAAAAGAFKAFFVFLLTNPIGWIIGLVGLLAAAAYLIYDNWDSIGPWLSEVWDDICAIFADAWEWIKVTAAAAWESLSSTVTNVFSSIRDFFSGIFDRIRGIFQSDFVDGILSIVAKLHPLAIIVSIMDGLRSYFGEALGRIRDAFRSGFLNGLLAIVREFNPLSIITNALNSVVKHLTGFSIKDIGTKIIDGFYSGLTDAWTKVSAWFTGITETIEGIWSSITGIFSGASEEAKKADEELREHDRRELDRNAEMFDQAMDLERALALGHEFPAAAEALPKADQVMREQVAAQQAAANSSLGITISNRSGLPVEAVGNGPMADNVDINNDDPYLGQRNYWG